MPAARNQLAAVRRRSVVNSRPARSNGSSGRMRESRCCAKRANQVDKNAGIIHDVIAGPPGRCRVATTSLQEGPALHQPSYDTTIPNKFQESAVYKKKVV